MTARTATAAWLPVAALSVTMLLCCCAARQEAAGQSIRIGAYRPKLVIVFLDETASREQAWEPMRDGVAMIASRLKNRDAFTVIGIDDHGGDEDDVRVPLSIVQAQTDLNIAELNQQRQAIVQQVAKLRRRGNPQHTDIVGPIRQALGIVKMQSQRDAVLAFFSDMQQDPKMPDADAFKGIQFPAGTKSYCFYVNGTKQYDFPATVALWQPLLTSAGIEIRTTDFHQKGTVAVALNTAFPQ